MTDESGHDLHNPFFSEETSDLFFSFSLLFRLQVCMFIAEFNKQIYTSV